MTRVGTSSAVASLVAMWLLMGLVACESPAERANTAGEAGAAGTGMGGAGNGTGGDGGSTTAGQGGVDASDQDAPRPSIEELPSTQTVRIELTNNSEESIWLLEDGDLCAGMKLESDRGGTWVELPIIASSSFAPDDVCCQGGCDWGSLQYHLVEVPAGASKLVEWDGRAAVLSEETYPCSFDEFHETGLQPVGAGQYRITLGFRLTWDERCIEKGEGVVWCTYSEAASLPPPIEVMCELPETLTVEFELPHSGDVDLTTSYP